jgi:hypothetical protein
MPSFADWLVLKKPLNAWAFKRKFQAFHEATERVVAEFSPLTDNDDPA